MDSLESHRDNIQINPKSQYPNSNQSSWKLSLSEGSACHWHETSGARLGGELVSWSLKFIGLE